MSDLSEALHAAAVATLPEQGSRESIKSQVVPEALTASSTNPDCMPPRTNQIKA